MRCQIKADGDRDSKESILSAFFDDDHDDEGSSHLSALKISFRNYIVYPEKKKEKKDETHL